MKQLLKVLILEDDDNDALLLEMALNRGGYAAQCHRVQTRKAMVAALERQSWDLIVSDYVMPGYNGLEALALVKEKAIDVPFIIVSGHITEDTAVAALKAGAHDYVMKDNLSRLGPVVERELREVELRREKRKTEEKTRAEHAITLILAHAESFTRAAPEILRTLLQVLEADFGALWRPGAQGEILEPLVADLRRPDRDLETFARHSRSLRLHRGEGLPGRVWQDLRPEWMVDLAADTVCPRREAAALAGLQSGLAFPVVEGTAFFGVLEFFSLRRLAYDSAWTSMMGAICSEIGQFIQRRNAEAALRRAHDELEVRVRQRTSELEAANAKLHTSIAERRRLEHELLEITEQERRRIGLDLHDDLGQQLTGIALMTKGLELKLTKSGAAAAVDAGRIHELVRQAMSHASGLAHDLATLDFKPNNLPEALNGLAGRTQELFAIVCSFEAEGPAPSLDANVVSQLYKIAQEAVTNAIKHGKAEQVGIRLVSHAEQLILTVRNTGAPFPDLQGQWTTGMGLRIMNYRAHLVGAALEVRGAGDRGTVVTCAMPLERR